MQAGAKRKWHVCVKIWRLPVWTDKHFRFLLEGQFLSLWLQWNLLGIALNWNTADFIVFFCSPVSLVAPHHTAILVWCKSFHWACSLRWKAPTWYLSLLFKKPGTFLTFLLKFLCSSHLGQSLQVYQARPTFFHSCHWFHSQGILRIQDYPRNK